MKKSIPITAVLCHILLLALVICIFIPGAKAVKGPAPLLIALTSIEIIYLIYIVKKKEKKRSASDLMLLIWAFILIWELLVTKFNMMHPVLVPAPENVFAVFADRPLELIKGIWDSLRLLIGGIIVGMVTGTAIGLICGWVRRLRDIFYPIATVLAPIPSIVFAPYVVALMPSFRSASYVVIILGIFWPQMLSTILRVDGIDKRILDSARMLHLNNWEMIFQILLPYVYPGIIKNLKITLTTSVMMLTFAEMMGATSGMGYFIVNYNTYGNYTNVVAGIIVVGIVVTILNRCSSLLEKILIKWE